METVIHTIALPLGYLMKGCQQIFSNYGWAIVAFTLLCKLLLLPLSVWLHKNSIKMVKLQPEINRIKTNFFGDQDAIAEAQAALFKREKYNPLASTIPLVIQILLLMGVIEVIYRPLTYLLGLSPEIIAELTHLGAELTGANPMESSIQLTVVQAIKNPEFFSAFTTLGNKYLPVLTQIQQLDFWFLGMDISWIPNAVRSYVMAAPVAAGFSAWLLCYMQNKCNVLQMEQSAMNQYGLMAFSIGLSLYLGWFVPVGVAVYWIFSNLFAIIQQLILNAVISPKKYVDYAALEESKKTLDALNRLGGKKKRFSKDVSTKREKADYKRFFSIINKHLVFYSEGSGFYKYFQGNYSGPQLGSMRFW